MSGDQEKSSYTHPPFEAYLGDESYAFVSYAHQDVKTVYPEITKWNDQGFRLWYDEGISAAGEWLEEIAGAIGGCSLFIVLISPRSVVSQFVKNEILYALDKGRPFLAIHLEKTGLPKGLELCMSGHQALRKYELEEERYQRKLRNVLNGFLSSSTKIDMIRPSIDLPIRKIDTRHLWPGIESLPKPPQPKVEEDQPTEEVASEEASSIEAKEEPATPVEEVKEEAVPAKEPEPPAQEESVPPVVEPAAPVIEVGDPEDFTNVPNQGSPFTVSEIEYPMLWVEPGPLVVNLPWKDEPEVVNVTHGFWLGERLITQGDYLRIVGRHTNYFWDSDKLPVEQVSWLDCIEFCKALTALERREERLPKGFEFRLPLEIEWEYACRAGTETPYFFGTDPDELFDYGWVRGNSKHRTHEVSQKKPNPWGFHDMYGNVREWVHDSYYTSINEGLAGEIPDEFRISRGGGYMARRKDCDSTSRVTNSLFHRFRNLGFRMALSGIVSDPEGESS